MLYKLWLYDLIKRHKTLKYYKSYKNFHKLSRQEILNYQKKKLSDQINFHYENNSFFRKNLEKAKIMPSDFNRIEDLKRIPLIDRTDLQKFYNNMITKNIRRKFYSSSSGTTGIPVRYAKDVNGISAGHAAFFCLMNVGGWSFNQNLAHVWGNPTSIKKWNKISSKLRTKIFRQLNIDSTMTNSEDGTQRVINKIIKFKPNCIEGYASSIYNLAVYSKKKSIKFPFLQSVITTGENLLPYYKNFISKNLAPVSDLYGCGEINGVAIKPFSHDRYYIADYHVFLEAIPISGTNAKELLITDLDNRAFPFIRYKVGDLVDDIYEPAKGGIFPFTFFKKIQGRSIDTIYLANGKCLQPINLFGGTLFREIGGVKQHKVIMKENKLIFLFSTENNFNRRMAIKKIEEYLKEYQLSFEIKLVDKVLPNKSGKCIYFEKID